MEHVYDPDQEEEQWPQTNDGKNIGKENHIGIPGDRKDGGYGIECEDHIRKFNVYYHNKKRGDVQFVILADKEPRTYISRKNIEITAQEQNQLIILRFDFLFLISLNKHFNSLENQPASEYQKNPVKSLYKRRTRENKNES